ncbi:MAG: hypothetical protein LBU17_06565 [Treponema sp.]|jgi:hypothetical protein|nr:hypothetical protein [Treponema sp.]
MGELADYRNALSEAIDARRKGLEKSEVVKLKEELRLFQSSVLSLYTLCLKKGLIKDDPYKQDIKVGEIEIPATSSFPDTEMVDQISIRWSQYDTQLDYLVNFYQFGLEFLGPERIKRILGLVTYIDWQHFTLDSPSINTRAVADLTNKVRGGTDPVSTSIIIETTSNLSKLSGSILGYLKALSDFNREAYKLEIRNVITASMAEAPSIAQIKKQFAVSMPGRPFYTALVEELLREDYSKEGPGLREAVLKALKAPDTKVKAAKPVVSYKSILLEGIQDMSSIVPTLNEIGVKLDDNDLLFQNQKATFWGKLKHLWDQIFNKEQEPTIYVLEYPDENRGVVLKDKVNFMDLRSDMDKKAKTLASLSARGPKLEAVPEEQLNGFLETSIKEMQSLHRTLSALDECFKAQVAQDDRNKVRGIKPELATMKNAFLRANQKRHDYSAQKEEEEQFKRLGISPLT